MSRGTKAFAAAVAGMIVLGGIGELVGYFRGASKAKAARAQFDEITTENALLKQQLETQAAQTKSFVESLEADRAKAQAPSATR